MLNRFVLTVWVWISMIVDLNFLQKINIYYQYLSLKDQILYLINIKKKRSGNELEKSTKKL